MPNWLKYTLGGAVTVVAIALIYDTYVNINEPALQIEQATQELLEQRE